MNGVGTFLSDLVCAVGVEILNRKINTVNKNTGIIRPGVHKFTKILGSRRGNMNFHTEGQQILDTAVQNVLVWATWRPGFVSP
jgi:hypothetical protein